MSAGVVVDLDEVADLWPRISQFISPLCTLDDYERACALLDQVIDRSAGNENDPLAPLAALLGILIEDYEDAHVPDPGGDPVAALEYLMWEHHLEATGLPEVASPEHLQQILNRRRQLTVEQISMLSRRFHVSPAVFVPTVTSAPEPTVPAREQAPPSGR